MFLKLLLNIATVHWFEVQLFRVCKFLKHVSGYFKQGFGLIFLFCSMILINIRKCRIVISKKSYRYAYYVGGKLKYVGGMHNIYMRLRKQKSSTGVFYYW